jgi:uncharacterized alkaline shock family protein YloU
MSTGTTQGGTDAAPISSGNGGADRSLGDQQQSDERVPGGELIQTERGQTTIAESVVAKVASLAAREVEGVDSLGGAIAGALSGVVGRIRGDEHRTAGVGVEVGQRQAAVDLTMTVRYPYPIHETAQAVRDNVIDRIESMTGLHVVEVNVAVTDLAFDPDSPYASGATRVE